LLGRESIVTSLLKTVVFFSSKVMKLNFETDHATSTTLLSLPGASTPYKRWSKCTMKKIGGEVFAGLRGWEVHKLSDNRPTLN